MSIRKGIALVLAAMLICLACVVSAGAETAPEDAEYRRKQLDKFEQMKTYTIPVELSKDGGYILKSEKFYTREVIGVADNGDFILGSWKSSYSDTNVPMSTDRFEVPGTCVMFAYSIDILAGTDFPYSGIFWKDVTRTVKKVEIILSGLCRNVDIGIFVNDKLTYGNDNCPSHKEWTPAQA